MSKPTLTPDQFIDEMNSRLGQHQNYRQGMAFVPYPEGSTGRSMTGYCVTGPFYLMGVYTQVAHEVIEKFDLAG